MTSIPEMPANDPAAVERLTAGAEDRWPACDADYFIGDLCRSYPVVIVAEVGNRAVNKWGKTRLDNAKRSWMRKTCQGLVDDGWKPEKANGKSGPVPAIPVDNSSRYVRATEDDIHPSRRKPQP